VLDSIGNMGLLLHAMGQLEEARPLLEKHMQACRETLGDRHPHTLISINNVGMLLHAIGKLEEAGPLLEEAVQASREMGGERHPVTLISIGNLADLLRATGALVEAEAVLGTSAVLPWPLRRRSSAATICILCCSPLRQCGCSTRSRAARRRARSYWRPRLLGWPRCLATPTHRHANTGRFSLRWSEKCRGERVQHVLTFHVFVPLSRQPQPESK
jgi:hypothetical protein